MHAAGDYELRMAFFRDPAGILLAIMAEQGAYTGGLTARERLTGSNEPPEGAAGGVGYPPPAR